MRLDCKVALPHWTVCDTLAIMLMIWYCSVCQDRFGPMSLKYWLFCSWIRSRNKNMRKWWFQRWLQGRPWYWFVLTFWILYPWLPAKWMTWTEQIPSSSDARSPFTDSCSSGKNLPSKICSLGVVFVFPLLYGQFQSPRVWDLVIRCFDSFTNNDAKLLFMPVFLNLQKSCGYQGV